MDKAKETKNLESRGSRDGTAENPHSSGLTAYKEEYYYDPGTSSNLTLKLRFWSEFKGGHLVWQKRGDWYWG